MFEKPTGATNTEGLSNSLHGAELLELPDLKVFETPDRRLCVDGYYLFMTGRGRHTWSKDPEAYLKDDADWTTEETEAMKEVRSKIEASKAYTSWLGDVAQKSE